MKRAICACVLTLLLVLTCSALAACSKTGSVPVTAPAQDSVVITYAAIVPEDMSAAELLENMEVAKTMLQQRLDNLGYPDSSVRISGDRQLVVVLSELEEPEKVVQKLSVTAVVTFVDADGKVWLEGKDIEKAEYAYGPTDASGLSTHYVKLELTPDGQTKLHEASVSVLKKADTGDNYLAIEMDGERISAPYVQQELNDDSVVITVNRENAEEEARYLADIISAGRLPFELSCLRIEFPVSD